MNYLRCAGLGLDLAVASLIPGAVPYETLSGRAWRMHVKGQPVWGWTAAGIDRIFGPGHCERSHEAERRARPTLYPSEPANENRLSA